MIQRLPKLEKEDLDRVLECVYCPFYKECEKTIETPEDNLDGTCKTREIFMNKLKGLDLNV